MLWVLYLEEALEVLAGDHPEDGKQQMLWRMRTQAVRRLQDYWTPHFLNHCKASLGRVVDCRPLVEEYVRLSTCDGPLEVPIRPGVERSQLERSAVSPYSYNSKLSKKQLWRSHLSSRKPHQANAGGGGGKEATSICQWLPLDDKACLNGCTSIAHNKEWDLISPATVHPNAGGFQLSIQVAQAGKDQVLPDVDVPHVCMGTPAMHVPTDIDLPVRPPDAHCFAHMGPALSADEMAGSPYRAFLEAGGLEGPLLHLSLWRELELLLSFLLKAQIEDSLSAQKQAVARRIINVFLGGKAETTLLIQSGTCARLCELLPSGKAIPWIYAAKHDICKVLRGKVLMSVTKSSLTPPGFIIEKKKHSFPSFSCGF